MVMKMTQNEIDSCTRTTENPRIPLRENKSSLMIENPNRKVIYIITIDPCIKSLQDKLKCDYGAFDQNNFFFIELKGSDTKHGVAQLESSIKLFSPFFTDKKKSCVLCATRFPKAGPGVAQIKKSFYAKNKIHLQITNNIEFI